MRKVKTRSEAGPGRVERETAERAEVTRQAAEEPSEEQLPDAQPNVARRPNEEIKEEAVERLDISRQLCEVVGTNFGSVLDRVRSAKKFGKVVSDTIRFGLAGLIRFPDDYIRIEVGVCQRLVIAHWSHHDCD